MGFLQGIETKLSRLLEQPFGRLFRSEVKPVELARRLAREMDARKTVSLNAVYVPNSYTVYLSSEDYERIREHRQELVAELEAYLLEYARREGVKVGERPAVGISLDDRLRLGEFGVAARKVAPSRPAVKAGRSAGPVGHSQVDASSQAGAPSHAWLRAGDRRIQLTGESLLVGRSRECDLVLDDANISRKHVEIRRSQAGWEVVDLGSTNGTAVNGRTVRGGVPLRHGDTVTLGGSELLFQEE